MDMYFYYEETIQAYKTIIIRRKVGFKCVRPVLLLPETKVSSSGFAIRLFDSERYGSPEGSTIQALRALILQATQNVCRL